MWSSPAIALARWQNRGLEKSAEQIKTISWHGMEVLTNALVPFDASHRFFSTFRVKGNISQFEEKNAYYSDFKRDQVTCSRQKN